MQKLKVLEIKENEIIFENGYKLASEHRQDCCEEHYLYFKDLTLNDFEGLEFDLTGENFFRRITDYGIELIPLVGHSVKIPSYSDNNGYYSSDLSLVIIGDKYKATYDISDCQECK